MTRGLRETDLGSDSWSEGDRSSLWLMVWGRQILAVTRGMREKDLCSDSSTEVTDPGNGSWSEGDTSWQ